jgi:hypothetical protein
MYHKRLNWLWFFVQGEKRPGLHHTIVWSKPGVKLLIYTGRAKNYFS